MPGLDLGIVYLTVGTLIDIGIAVAIFILFLLLGKLFSRYVIRLIDRLTAKTKTSLDDFLVSAFKRPVEASFLLLGLYASLSYLDVDISRVLILSRFFRSMVVILIAWGLFNLLSDYDLLGEEIQTKLNLKVDTILVPFLSKMIKFLIVALAITTLAQEWGYDVNGLITGLGLGGLAFALAAKDAVANIFGGIIIITDKPFSIGDWISTPSVEGTVEDITFRSTRVRTFAQALVTVPNSTLANESITNWSKMGKRRISFNLGLTYSTPGEKIRVCIDRIRSMLEQHPEIHQETIFVRFDEFGDSSLNIFLYFFTNTTKWAEFLRVKEDVNFKIMQILEEEGVSVAFPSRSIYIENNAANFNTGDNNE